MNKEEEIILGNILKAKERGDKEEVGRLRKRIARVQKRLQRESSWLF